jgi:hypothetical protein
MQPTFRSQISPSIVKQVDSIVELVQSAQVRSSQTTHSHVDRSSKGAHSRPAKIFVMNQPLQLRWNREEMELAHAAANVELNTGRPAQVEEAALQQQNKGKPAALPHHRNVSTSKLPLYARTTITSTTSSRLPNKNDAGGTNTSSNADHSSSHRSRYNQLSSPHPAIVSSRQPQRPASTRASNHQRRVRKAGAKRKPPGQLMWVNTEEALLFDPSLLRSQFQSLDSAIAQAAASEQ